MIANLDQPAHKVYTPLCVLRKDYYNQAYYPTTGCYDLDRAHAGLYWTVLALEA